MTLLEPLVGQTLTNLIYNYIHGHIQKICKDSFDSSFISVLEKVVDVNDLRDAIYIILF